LSASALQYIQYVSAFCLLPSMNPEIHSREAISININQIKSVEITIKPEIENVDVQNLDCALLCTRERVTGS